MPRFARLLHCAAAFSCSLFALSVSAAPVEAGTSGFPANEDLRHYRSLSDPRLSPDGRRVLIRITDATADGGKSHLWLVDIASNTARQLTYSPDADKAGEQHGEWMPDDGSILFLAHRGEHTELFRLTMAGGEARPFDLKVLPPADRSRLPGALPPPGALSSAAATPNEPKPATAPIAAPEPLPIDVKSFSVSPDGKWIALLAEDPQTPGEKKQATEKADATWVDHNIHGTRLYLLDPASDRLTPVALAPEIRELSWSRDATRLLVLREEPNNAGDLGPARSAWLLTIPSGSQPPSPPQPLAGLPPTIEQATWSADGQSLALLAQARADTPPGYRDLYTYTLASNGLRDLTGGFCGSVGFDAPVALPDGAIAQTVATGVRTTLALLQPAQPGPLAPELLPFPAPVVEAFHTNAQHTGWVFLGHSSTQPPTLYYTASLRQPARSLNTPSLVPANARTVAPEHLHWRSDKLTIEGLLFLPPQAASQRVPLVLLVHGGPLGAFQDGYHPFIPFLLGHGWAVLETNPRGSSNYGAAFAAANRNDLGGGDYRDIMAGVDYVLNARPIDPHRLAMYGYSYGGEMAGFIEGKTARFKAIVSGAPVIDQFSEYGTESESWYDRWYFGKPWEHAMDALRESPLSGAAHASTPFLLLQGETDTTDPPGQSQEMYRALRQMNVPVDLVTYPRVDHGPLAEAISGAPTPEPWHGYDARERIAAFFQKAFSAAQPTVPAPAK